MKRFLIVMLSAVMILTFAACGGIGGKEVKFEPKLNTSFSVNAAIKYGEQEYKAAIKRYGKANWDVEFTDPNTLSGVLLAFRDDQVDASYKGLSFSVPKSALPLKSMLTTLINVVDEIAEKPEIKCEEKDSVMLCEGENEQGKYTLKLDQTGALNGFLIPNFELEMIFTDFTPGESSPSTQPTGEITETTKTTDETSTETTKESDKQTIGDDVTETTEAQEETETQMTTETSNNDPKTSETTVITTE